MVFSVLGSETNSGNQNEASLKNYNQKYSQDLAHSRTGCSAALCIPDRISVKPSTLSPADAEESPVTRAPLSIVSKCHSEKEEEHESL